MSDTSFAPTESDIASVFTSAPSPEPTPAPAEQPSTPSLSPTPAPSPSPAPTPTPSPSPPVPAPGAVAPAMTPSPAPAPAPDPLAQTLEGINRTLEGLPAQMQRVQQPPAPPQAPQDDTPQYRYDVPPELMAAMNNEDPNVQRQGLAHYATGISRTVHQQAMANVKAMITRDVVPAVQRMIQTSLAQAELFRDFYGTHKDLDNDNLRQHVMAVAQSLVTPQTKWNAAFRDQLATAVRQRMNMPAPGAAPAPAPVPAPTPPPPGMFQPGTRGGPGFAPRTTVDDIADTLKGF